MLVSTLDAHLFKKYEVSAAPSDHFARLAKADNTAALCAFV